MFSRGRFYYTKPQAYKSNLEDNRGTSREFLRSAFGKVVGLLGNYKLERKEGTCFGY